MVPSLLETTVWKPIDRFYLLSETEIEGNDVLNILPGINLSTVIAAVAVYLGVYFYAMPMKGAKPLKVGPFAKAFILLHNVLLAVYSAVVFLETAPLVLNCVITHKGLVGAASSCPGLKSSRMMFWAWTFYISKFYEFVDTWLLLARRIKPIFLQTYHHIGAVVAMYLLLEARFPGVWIFVVLNSFIHSLMYSYYALTTVGIRPPMKQLITSLQIIQFFSGNYMAFVAYWNQSPPLNKAQLDSMLFNQIYTGILVVLFMNFSYHTYVKKSNRKHVKPSVKEA